MDFSFSSEQDQLRAATRSWLANTLDHSQIAALADSEPGWVPATWSQIADFGWLDRDLLTVTDLAIVAEELGAGLYAGPLLSTIAALPLLDSDAATRASSGQLKATVAWGADPRHLDVSHGKVTGELRHLPDLALCDVVLVPSGEGRWFSVDPTQPGSQVLPRATTDRTRRVGDLVLDEAVITALDIAPATADFARMRWQTLLAAESCGIGLKVLELAKDYVTQRQQFGRVIGTYQAISHRVADIYTRTELSRSLMYWATAALDDASFDAEDAVHAAKAYACESAVKSCEESIQAHGGIGFTWDHVLHRFYKRARANAAVGGRADAHRASIAEAIFA